MTAFCLSEDASPIKEGGESLALSVRALRLAVHRALLGSVQGCSPCQARRSSPLSPKPSPSLAFAKPGKSLQVVCSVAPTLHRKQEKGDSHPAPSRKATAVFPGKSFLPVD